MKALSLKQPWASVIIDGPKRLENRTRRTAFRGWVLLHASRQFDRTVEAWIQARQAAFTAPLDLAELRTGLIIAQRANLPQGGIIGAMEITDCVQSSLSPWWMGPHGYLIRRVVQLPFFPCKGALGFFDVQLPPETEALIPKA